MNERRNEAVDIGASRLDFDKNAASEEEIRAYEADLHDALQAGNHDDVVSLVEQMAEIKAAELVVPVEKRLTSWIDDAVKRHAASAGAGALASFLLSSVVTAAATAKPPTIRQRLLNSIVAAIES